MLGGALPEFAGRHNLVMVVPDDINNPSSRVLENASFSEVCDSLTLQDCENLVQPVGVRATGNGERSCAMKEGIGSLCQSM
jgi:hypothetical protein